ncbi:V-type ATPase, D subunit [Ignisphaera aggregans DSM 17230]|uniref:V-type ATPase, D subunit n=1 Tax=Ignisphaera aggregans (strain DSM 17230 / JCM 13409 / AQ1.S1) TaxID=583356 RepID=E0SNP2_IGNAA|nr:V-type ATPase, D subunit [Ignisphaera aggregans DSM 17230]
MSTEIIRLARVTKTELIRLRRRLALARRFHRILRDRMTLLVQEMFITLKRAIELRKKLNQLLEEIYPQYFKALSIYGYEELIVRTLPVSIGIEIVAGTRNIMGVVAPMIDVKSIPQNSPLLPLEVVNIQLKREEIIRTIIDLAESEKTLYLLALEVSRLRRRVTMLEKILIPRIVNTIRYLTMKFDEIEREERVRQLKVKAVLARRR